MNPTTIEPDLDTESTTDVFGPIATFLSLRKWTGFAGITLPWILVLYVWKFAPSISDYYHTDGRNWFVGSLFTIGAFLVSYFGYDNTDRIMSAIAGVCAFGVALCPTDLVKDHVTLIGGLHFTFAASLFLILAWFSLLQFPKSKKPVPTRNKLKRNKIYRICGFIMLGALILIAVTKLTSLEETLASLHPVFWLEAICLQAFGVSWMVKGEVILKDSAG
jgi:hypothetical protein